MSFELPEAFPVTGVGIVALLFLNVSKVSKHRKISGVKYPNLYASDAEAQADPAKKVFNCVQRSHANTLEFVPYVLSLFGYLSFFQPKFATGALLFWVVGRFFYSINYSTGKPEARNNGLALLAYPGLLALIGGVIYTTAVHAPQYLKV